MSAPNEGMGKESTFDANRVAGYNEPNRQKVAEIKAEAIVVLAVMAALRAAFEPCVSLLVAQMHAQGFVAAQLAV